MEPRIEMSEEKTLIGINMQMSLSDNKTGLLWNQFMGNKDITGVPLCLKIRITPYFYSMQIYDSAFDFQHIDVNKLFYKWAAVEVDDIDSIPENMNSIILPEGLYAVFLHKGPARTTPVTFQFIFGTWLPGSKYKLDNRPHFEKLGEKYNNESDNSEEEIWIPITEK